MRENLTEANKGNEETSGKFSGLNPSLSSLPPVKILSYLQPGDHLLYNIRNFFDDPFGFVIDAIIRFKTWSDVAHIEIYDGNGMSLAARSNGVNRYPFRRSGLVCVRRPDQWNHGAMTFWFEHAARFKKYDWLGLLCFTLAVKQGSPDRMFCSEFARNAGKTAGMRSFDNWWPGDKVAPGSFEMVGGFTETFRAK